MKRFIYYFFVITIFSIVLSACNSGSSETKQNTQSERESLHKEVIEIHDAVMPKMRDINFVKRKLKDQIANGEIADSMIVIINEHIAELGSAEDGMMDWMKDFAKYQSIPDGQAVEYLSEEKIRISAVSDQMLSSLEEATNLLKNLEDQNEN